MNDETIPIEVCLREMRECAGYAVSDKGDRDKLMDVFQVRLRKYLAERAAASEETRRKQQEVEQMRERMDD